MEQLIVAGYIPFTNVQISFTFFAIVISAALAGWFYWSLETKLKHPDPMFAPNIGSDF